MLELKGVLDDHQLSERAVTHLFSDNSPIQPTCAGDWLVSLWAGLFAVCMFMDTARHDLH